MVNIPYFIDGVLIAVIIYLIVGLLFAIYSHHTVTEVIDERVRNGQMSKELANILTHVVMIFLVLFWPYFVVEFVIYFVKKLINLIGGNEQ